VDRFNAAWNAHDLAAAVSMISGDCVFESTSPAPDGARVVGPTAIRDAWAPIFDNEHSHFTVEDSIATVDHVVQRWRYDWVRDMCVASTSLPCGAARSRQNWPTSKGSCGFVSGVSTATQITSQTLARR
jgi:hypothetical protein